MEPNDVERLLAGYLLPEPPQSMDRRIMASAVDRLLLARIRFLASEWFGWLLDAAGFGFVRWAVDRLAGRETEYQITII